MRDTKQRTGLVLGSAILTLALFACFDNGSTAVEAQTITTDEASTGQPMTIQYLEIVTPQVDATCKTYEQLHGVTFSEPEAALGNARLAELPSGGLLAVRAPLRTTERPVVRPYVLVEDIEASVAKAAASGAQIALPPMKLPGYGTCAIFIQGGIEHGLWQPSSD